MVPTELGSGLTAAEVAERVHAGEVNATREVTSRPLSEIVKANVFTRFNGLLGALLILVLVTGSYKDALFGIALVFNSVLGIAQEWHAKRKLDSLAVMHAPTARVLRDGAVSEIPMGDVVRDDVVELRSGDQVGADGPILAADNLEIDESNLTGESDAVHKQPGDEVSSGTAVVAGSGWFRAAVVGEQATAQKLAAEARQFTRAHSEVQHSTNVLLRWLTWIVLGMLPIAIFSQIRAFGVDDWRDVILRTAAGLVGLVPEGLVVLTTLAFLLAAVQLTRKQALVQELPAVEGLARVDVICVDKTGTLTEGKIAYESIEALPPYDEETVTRALGALAHDPQANQTTQAIAEAVPDPGVDVVARAAFSSARKWSGADLGDGDCWLLGAPDVLLAGMPNEEELSTKVGELSDEGKRVVLLAQVSSLPAEGQPPSNIRPAALVVLTEVMRPDAKATLDYFREQGVTVKVISGDTPRTVAAVAKRAGLDVGEPVDARTLPLESPDLMAEIAENTTVFGRVTPGQKRALVRALQSRGHVVAMTGDGVNDVLALKDADIGIAMGNAAQATKAVAQLVLLDSKFSHLPDVLAEGRRLIGNVERVASLFLAKNAMSAVAILVAAVAGLAFPFLPRQLTLVSTFTIGIPAAILALGPNKRRYLPGFLRRVLALSLPAGVVAGVAGLFTYVTLARGPGDLVASTAALVAVLVVNFWLLGVLARPYLPWKVGVVLAMVACVVLAFWLPVGQSFFALQLDQAAITRGLAAGTVGAIVVEIAYHLSRQQEPSVEAGHRAPRPGEVPSTEERPLGTRPYVVEAGQGQTVPDARKDADGD
ncbi:MAG TPA: HAD-IC family P-type ATPase [Propionibacteriaceae bacterium]|nr:HAD-IC family P-type ATPase [Propionibacteriaceae bacterium]